MPWIDIDGDSTENWTDVNEGLTISIASIAVADLTICDTDINEIAGDTSSNWTDIG